MYISGRLLSSPYFSRKLFFPKLLISCVLLLSGCSGDDLNNVKTNADGSIVISAEMADTAKKEGFDSIPTQYMIKLKWNPPTTKVGGTPLNAAEIKEYRISYFQTGSSNETTATLLTVDKDTLSLGIPVQSKGSYQFKITTIDISGRESEPQLVTAAL